MRLYQWKMMACFLGLSLGALAVFAGPPDEKLEVPPLPPPAKKAVAPETTFPPLTPPPLNKPTSPEKGTDTLPPIPQPIAIPKEDVRTIEIEVPVIQNPIPSNEGKPKLAVDVPAVNPNKVIDVPPPPISIATDDTKAPPENSKPQTIFLQTPQVEPTKPLDPQPPVPSVNVTPVSGLEPLPLTTNPVKESQAPVQATSKPIPSKTKTSEGKLKLLLRMGDGTPRFEIRSVDGAELLFKVYAEKMEMQATPEGAKSPLAGVTASGKVRFTAYGVEGTCDQLSILSGTGEVLLKGNVVMRSKHGKSWSELTADKMIYQIGVSTPIAPANNNRTSTIQKP